MRTIRFLLEKEFRQIVRNKALLPLLVVAPVMQLLILPLAADYEVKNINVAVVDQDHSPYSERLVAKILSSGYFRPAGYCLSYAEALRLVESDQADLVLVIPSGFEKALVRGSGLPIFVAINAINGVKAGLGGVYLNSILTTFSDEIRLEQIPPVRWQAAPVISLTASNWFNPSMNYRFFMVPGILVVLVTMVGAYMCALNIVREKETGTIEQINVTPIRKYEFVLGKLIPFWIVGMLIFSLGLLVIARLVYGIIPLGNLWLLYGYLALYLVALLGFGLLISTYSDTQQQAMSVAFFFIMIFMLMSGLFTPLDGMPGWAYTIARFVPVTYFIEVVRMIVLKGSGFEEIGRHFLIMSGFAVLLNGWAIANYRKTG